MTAQVSGEQRSCQTSVRNCSCSQQLGLAGPPSLEDPTLFPWRSYKSPGSWQRRCRDKSPWAELLAPALEDVRSLMIHFPPRIIISPHTHTHTKCWVQKAPSSAAVSLYICSAETSLLITRRVTMSKLLSGLRAWCSRCSTSHLTGAKQRWKSKRMGKHVH